MRCTERRLDTENLHLKASLAAPKIATSVAPHSTAALYPLMRKIREIEIYFVSLTTERVSESLPLNLVSRQEMSHQNVPF